MRYAIVSDIHANRQAWESVLADMEAQHADVLVCLGDVVGYGPKPQAVLDSVRERAAGIVLGNHDAAVCGRMDASIFNDYARAIIDWTRNQLDEDAVNYLAEVPLALEEEDALFVHAEMIEPGRFDYILDADTAAEHLAACPEHRIVFIGHTHNPGVFVLEGDAASALPDDDFGIEDNRRYVVNVGSVGEPRDPDDLRARYVIYDSDTRTVTFRGVAFDFKAYQADLDEVGLNIEPFFLQIANEESTASQEEPLAPAMRRQPVIPVQRRGQGGTRRLVVPIRPPGVAPPQPAAKAGKAGKAGKKAEIPKQTGPAPATAATQKPKRRIPAGAASIAAAVILLGALVPAAWWTLYRDDSPGPVSDASERTAEENIEPGQGGGILAEMVARETGQASPAGQNKPAPAKTPAPAPVATTGPMPMRAFLRAYWPADKDFIVTAGRYEGIKSSSRGKPGIGRAKSGFGKALAVNPASGLVFGDTNAWTVGDGGLTVSFWFQGDKPDGKMKHLVGTRSPGASPGSGGWSIFTTKSKCGILVHDGSVKKTLDHDFKPAGKSEPWRHLAAVIDLKQGRLSLFKNGKPAGKEYISKLGSTIPATHPLSIGIDPGGDMRFSYKGKIDDLAIWDRPLSPTQIEMIFLRGEKNKNPLSKLLDLTVK